MFVDSSAISTICPGRACKRVALVTIGHCSTGNCNCRHRTPSLWLSFEIRQIKSKAATSVTTLLKTPKTSIASDWKWLYSKEDNTHLSSNRNHGYRYHIHSDNGVCSYCYRYVHPIEREYKIDIIRFF